MTVAAVAAVVPCKDEAERIAATVAAVARSPQVGLVVVVDDGSTDGTAELARAAGAEVVRHARNRGKAAAMRPAAPGYVAATSGRRPRRAAAPRGRPPALRRRRPRGHRDQPRRARRRPCSTGTADMTIATLPPQNTAGWRPRAGRRPGPARDRAPHRFPGGATAFGHALPDPAAFEAASPLARGWGVEVGADRRRAAAPGCAVVEVPCELHHRVSGSDWRGQLHRARQYRDVALALVHRRRVRGLSAAPHADPAAGLHRGPGSRHRARALLAVSFALLLPSASSAPVPPSRRSARGAGRPGSCPWSPGPAAWSRRLLWTAYVLGACGVALAAAPRAPAALVLASPPGARRPRAAHRPVRLGGPHNYAHTAGSSCRAATPDLVPPEAWAGGLDPVTSRVEPPWTETVSVYGPFATALHALSSLLGGDSMRQTVWVWQVSSCSGGWRCGGSCCAGGGPGRVDMLWTLNPLVFGVGVLGAHIDVVAAALALAALVVAARSPLVAGVLTGLAVSTKITFGLVGVAVLLGWLERDRARIQRRGAVYAAAAAVVVVPLHLWAGPHVFDQLGRARRSVSLATPWRLLVDWLTASAAGLDGPQPGLRGLGGAVRPVRGDAREADCGPAPATVVGAAVRWALVLSTAYALAAPYSLPWYDLLTWATPSRCWRPASSTWSLLGAARGAGRRLRAGPGGRHDAGRRAPHPLGAPQRGAVCRAAACGVALIVAGERAGRAELTAPRPPAP